jgi:hypothetical protein
METKQITASGSPPDGQRVHPDDRSRIGAYKGAGWERYDTCQLPSGQIVYRLRKKQTR